MLIEEAMWSTSRVKSSRQGASHHLGHHLDGLSLAKPQGMPIRLLYPHAEHKEILSRIPRQHLQRSQARNTHSDDHHIGRTPSNIDSVITHRTLPLPRLHLSILDSLAPRTLDGPVSPEPTGKHRLPGGARRDGSFRLGCI